MFLFLRDKPPLEIYTILTESLTCFLPGRAKDLSASLWFHGQYFFLSNATTCPCGLRGSPSWAWQECNRLLRLGRP